MPMFINPKKKRRARKRKARRARKRLYGAAAMAKRGKLLGAAAKAARRRRPAAKRSKRRRSRGTIQSVRRAGSKRPVSRARWLASGFRRNLMANRKSRKRRYRRNPTLFGGGMVRRAMQIAQGGAGVVAGKIVVRQVTKLVPNVDPSTPVGIAVQLGIALAAGIAGQRFLKLRGPFADGLVYGAAAGAVESAIKLIAPGQAAAFLGQYDDEYEVPLAAYPSAAMLPPSREQAALMGAYATGMY